MLELFKRNHLFNSLLLIPYALVLRSVVLLFSQARVEGVQYGVWGNEFVAMVHSWGAVEILLSTLLVFIQAAMVNRLFIKQSMLGEINLFPGLAYVLLTSLHPSFIAMSSILLANTTLLIALAFLFDALKKEKQMENRFMAGFWLAISGLLFTPYFILVVFGLISMSMLKTLKLKDVFQYLTGYLCPYLIGWFVRIIVHDDPTPAFFDIFQTFGLPQIGPFREISDIIVLSILALLLFIGILGYTQVVARKNIHAQKKIDILYTMIVFAFFMGFFPEQIGINFLLIFLIPFSFFMAVLLRMIRHPAAAESIHFILFVAAVISQVLFLV